MVKKTALFLCAVLFIIGFTSFGQGVEYGISYEAGIVLSGREKTTEMQNLAIVEPWDTYSVRPFSIWNTQHLKFDIYPKRRLKGLSVSLGLRLFSYGWKKDTVLTSHYTMGSWEVVYGRREKNVSYLSPTFSIGYEFFLKELFKFKCSASIGPQGVALRVKQHSYAFDEAGIGPFEKVDAELRDGEWNFGSINSFDAQFSTLFSYSNKGLSIYAGPSLYYFEGYKSDHFGLQLTGGISYRFSKDKD